MPAAHARLSEPTPKTCDQVHAGLFWARGKASDYICECGEPARHWAYQYTSMQELISPDGTRYSENFEDYAAMCSRCHFVFDSANDESLELKRGMANIHGRVALAELRRIDPEFDSLMRQHATVSLATAREAIQKRRDADPEYDRYIRENRSQAGKKAVEIREAKRRSDPEYDRRYVEIARNNGRQRWTCLVCSMESNACGIGTHQKSTGHVGKQKVGGV